MTEQEKANVQGKIKNEIKKVEGNKGTEKEKDTKKRVIIVSQGNEKRIKEIFTSSPITNYINLTTDRVTQCSLINERLRQHKSNTEIAIELIELKLFPSLKNKEKYIDLTKEQILKKAIKRVERHLASLKERESKGATKLLLKANNERIELFKKAKVSASL